jgi:GntR family transcriptional regulator
MQEGGMRLMIDANSHVPIYLQIVEGIRSSVAAGVFRPGEMLPSLRALAVDLQVNPNTVQKAYDELERGGLVHSRRGVGIFVAQHGVQSAKGHAEVSVLEAFQHGIRAGVAADMTPDHIRGVFDGAMDQAFKKSRTRR